MSRRLETAIAKLAETAIREYPIIQAEYLAICMDIEASLCSTGTEPVSGGVSVPMQERYVLAVDGNREAVRKRDWLEKVEEAIGRVSDEDATLAVAVCMEQKDIQTVMREFSIGSIPDYYRRLQKATYNIGRHMVGVMAP